MTEIDLHEPLLCPICRAPWKDEDTCYRCKGDLAVLRRIRKDAALSLERSKASLKASNLRDAQVFVDESLKLFLSREAISLKACLLAKEGQFQSAYRLFLVLRGR